MDMITLPHRGLLGSLPRGREATIAQSRRRVCPGFRCCWSRSCGVSIAEVSFRGQTCANDGPAGSKSRDVLRRDPRVVAITSCGRGPLYRRSLSTLAVGGRRGDETWGIVPMQIAEAESKGGTKKKKLRN